MVKDPRGYILVYVGRMHHLADIRGYAYEHRLNAEKKLGRRLRKGEQVHHDDEDKSNNAEDNLIITKNQVAHFFYHRKNLALKLKHPDEENVMVSCLCGCGETFLQYDSTNRFREYSHGHNPSDKKTQNLLLQFINAGKTTIDEFLKGSNGLSWAAVQVALSKMVANGSIVRVKRGKFGPLGTPKEVRVNSYIKCKCGCGEKILKFDSSWRERKYISGHNAMKKK